MSLGCGYRLDVVVENAIILELKSCDSIVPIHSVTTRSIKLFAFCRSRFSNMDTPTCGRKVMFTAHSLRSFKTLSAQRILGFSFTVERTVNENHPKLCFIWCVSQITTISTESMIRWVAETVALTVSLPGGLGFISFRPLTEKK